MKRDEQNNSYLYYQTILYWLESFHSSSRTINTSRHYQEKTIQNISNLTFLKLFCWLVQILSVPRTKHTVIPETRVKKYFLRA